MKSHQEERARFYSGISNFWADLYGEEYALYDVSLLEKEEMDEVRHISQCVGAIFFKTAQLLREVPDRTLLELGYPKETLSLLRLKILSSESVIARLDLLKTPKGYKCIEINSDTPTFIQELFRVNGLVCENYHLKDPNEGMEEKLAKALRDAIIESTSHMVAPNIVFTAHREHVEDRETVLYLQRLAEVPSRFVPLDELVIEKGVGLYDDRGRKINCLYRQTFPIEQLIRDEDAEGNRIGLWLLELVEQGKLILLNPPSAFLLQNKAVQAVIWGLHEERHPFYSEDEHNWIASYFLPTYLEQDPFLREGQAFVRKPSFGREGDTVAIFQQDGSLAHAEEQQTYTEYVPVYQQFVEAESTNFKSIKGPQTGKLLVGSFLLHGTPAAVGYRVGGEITNNLSYYFPIGLK